MQLMPGKATQLINGAKQGDLASFEQLILLYQDRVFSLSKRLTGSHHDAEDLAQEVFVRAYRYIASFRGDADFGTWLHRITLNTWLNTKRKTASSHIVSLDEPIETDKGEVAREVADENSDPQKIVTDGVLGELLQKAMDSLPKEQRAVLLLKDVEDHTYEEIAVMMSCSIGTVRSRLSRAREALKRQLESNGYHKYGRRAAVETQANKEIEIGITVPAAARKDGKGT